MPFKAQGSARSHGDDGQRNHEVGGTTQSAQLLDWVAPTALSTSDHSAILGPETTPESTAAALRQRRKGTVTLSVARRSMARYSNAAGVPPHLPAVPPVNHIWKPQSRGI